MDFFLISKYHSKYENVLYVAKTIYSCLDQPLTVDKVFNAINRKFALNESLEYEKVTSLSLLFLYVIGLIDVDSGLIKRSDKK